MLKALARTRQVAPGARVQIRSEEWIVRDVKASAVGGLELECVGISELVRDREAIFLDQIDKVDVLDPSDTRLIADSSPEYEASLLYLEAQLRQSFPTGEKIAIGHKAVMDPLPFQLDPTRLVLEQPRHRILIADTVGLGKTLEAGILVSELIRRGKGRRILVVTVKSMMLQFQKELWTRFTIPLTRLDSTGIQRIRAKIPANHNPFHYYDKTIISVDTLKRDSEYRNYLEKAYWDIIVIDEAHNVSFKGNRTLSNRLAKLLSERSDTLVLLSATPHNGRKESFASLMRMLNPTALPTDADYTREDIKGLFVRRFKNDVRDQIAMEFPERQVYRERAQASPQEESAFELLAGLKLGSDEQRQAGRMLFRTTLEKSLFSSPWACRQTLDERIRKNTREDASHPDLPQLIALRESVDAITAVAFSKYQRLLAILAQPGPLHWDGQDPHDRLVIFTERIETLRFLREHLPAALKLKPGQVAILHGQLPDTEQNAIVEAFGQAHSPLRLLIASDVASEGINLHYLSHRLIHFDIPWSLMVFQQRNGRVDRYGQETRPLITYLLTETRIDKIRGDWRVLEILTEKDEQAAKNIGDPSAFLGEYDIEREEQKVAEAIESGIGADRFASQLAGQPISLLDLLLVDDQPIGQPLEAVTADYPTLFKDDYDFLKRALVHLKRSRNIDLRAEASDADRRIELQASGELADYLARVLPREMRAENNLFVLSARREAMQQAISDARQSSSAWPVKQYLWPLHPLLQWTRFKLLAAFGRHHAPLIRTPHGLEPGEALVLISALIPNRRGQPVLNEWFGVLMGQEEVREVLSFDDAVRRTRLGQASYPNDSDRRPIDPAPYQSLLHRAIEEATGHMTRRLKAFEAQTAARLNQELAALRALKGKHLLQLELRFKTRQPEALVQSRKERETQELHRLFAEYQAWIEKTLKIEDRPHLTVAAVLIA